MKSRSLQLLNEMNKMLVNTANEKGICLKTEFGTVENFKKFVIAFTFKQLVDLGYEVKDAFDIVIGDGEYDKLVKRTWTALKAKAKS